MIKKIVIFLLFFSLFGCSSNNQLENKNNQEKNEELLIYYILKGNFLILENKTRLAAQAYENALSINYNFEIAFINLEIYLKNRDIFNVKRTYSIIEMNNDIDKIEKKMTSLSAFKLSYYLKNNVLISKYFNLLMNENDIHKKINNINEINNFIKNENFNDFYQYSLKNNINDYFLVLYKKEINLELLSNNLNKNKLNWEIINLFIKKDEKSLIDSYIYISKIVDNNLKISFLKEALSLSMNIENYEKSIEVLNELIIIEKDFRYLFTKLDYLYFLGKYKEFYDTYLEIIDLNKTETQNIYLNIAYINYLEKNSKNEEIKNFLNVLGNKFKNNFIYYYLKHDLLDINYIYNIANNEEEKYNNILKIYYSLNKEKEFINLYNKLSNKYSNVFNDLMYYKIIDFNLFYEKSLSYYYSGSIHSNHSDILNLISYEISKNSDSILDIEFSYSLALESLKFLESDNILNNYHYYDTLAYIYFKMGNFEEAYNIMRDNIIQIVPFIILGEKTIENYINIKKEMLNLN